MSQNELSPPILQRVLAYMQQYILDVITKASSMYASINSCLITVDCVLYFRRSSMFAAAVENTGMQQ